MSSHRLGIEATAEEKRLAESLVEALSLKDDEQRVQRITQWKSTNMPAVRQLLRETFDTMLEQLIEKLEHQGRRDREIRRLERERPRFDIDVKVTFQGVDGKRMVRQAPEPPQSSSTGEDWDDYDDDGGRSSNDDRSDSMNPNNDSYQAAMDNYSNQMNPNNDAYWSSRR